MKRLLLSLLWLIPSALFAQITIDETLTTQQLVEDILINASCAGTENFIQSTGTDFASVNGVGSFEANGSNFPFAAGIVLSSGSVSTAPGPNLTTQSNGVTAWPGDADLENFTGATATNNASFIQFDFTPFTEQLSFDFLMASEEYNQNFECTFTDAFAFILTDNDTGTSVNLAVLPGTNTPIEVTNIRPEVPNSCAAVNEEFFGQYNFLPFNDENAAATNFNGQTVELTASTTVVPGNSYTIKLVVADQTDSLFDIAVFIEAGSFNVTNTDLGEDLLVENGLASCEGDPVTLDATDPDAETYTWLLNDVVITGETSSTLIVTEPGEYSVVVTLTDLPDCEVRDDITVEFISEPAVNIDDVVSCMGETETLDTGLPASTTTFIWSLDGSVITGETGPSISATASGTYTVQAIFDAGCTYTDDAIATFNIAPILDLGEDINSCLEDAVTLDGSPTNVDPSTSTYEWFLNGTLITGETSATLEATAPGVYEVFVTFEGCVGTDTLTINQANEDGSSCNINDLCPDALPLVCGDTVTGTTVGSTSTGEPGTCGTGPGAPGNYYTFTGTGELIQLAMCNSTYDTKLQVFTGACDALTCVDGNDDSCGLQSEVDFLSEEGIEYTIYVFGFGTSVGDYELTVTCIEAPQGCLDAEEVVCGDVTSGTIVGAPATDVPLENCGNITTGDSPGVWFTFTGTGESTEFSLLNSSFDTGIQIYSGTCEELICVEGNDDFGTVEQSKVDFITTTGTEYLIYIYGEDGATGDFELSIQCNPPATCEDIEPLCSQEGLIFENTSDGSSAQDGIDYECLFSQPNPNWFYLEIGQEGDIDLEIVQNTAFDADGNPTGTELDVDFIAWGPFDSPDNACDNLNPSTSVDCSFSAAAIETFTIPNAQVGEVYILLITNFNGSSGFISVGQTGGDGNTNCGIVCPDFDIDLGEDQSVCDVNSVELTATLSGSNTATPSYEWSTGETTPSITVTESGVYEVIVTVDGCSESQIVNIDFGVTPTIELGSDFDTCFEDAIFLDASPSNIDPTQVTYQWFQDGIELPDTSSSIEVVELGNYEVVVSDNGCTATDSILITGSILDVQLIDNFQTCPNEIQTLTAATDAAGVSFQWFVNGTVIDGATSATYDVILPSTTVGTQTFTVEITRGVCSGIAEVDVTLYEVGNCVISEGLSPSGSPGFNDTLDLRFLSDRSGITNLQIYNRLGTLVFEQDSYTNEWRGQTDSGDDLPTGTYFYVISLEREDPTYGTQATGWIYLNQE